MSVVAGTTFPAVERARASYDPSVGLRAVAAGGRVEFEAGEESSAGMRRAIGEVLGGADAPAAHPITNRNVDGVLDMLESGRPIRTGGSINSSWTDEATIGIRLAGEEHIPINYGMLHTSPAITNAVTGVRELNMGQVGYGPVALALHPRMLERSTLTAVDSAFAGALIPPEHMVDAIGNAVVHRFAGLEPPKGHNEHPVEVDPQLRLRMVDPSADEMRNLLSTLPETTAGTPGLPPLPELQVYGGIDPSDVLEVRVHADAPREALEALRAAAAPHGIPVVLGPLADVEGQAAWQRPIELNLLARTTSDGDRSALGIVYDTMKAARDRGGWDSVADLWSAAARTAARA